MSLSFVALLTLVGSSVVIPFVLQPSKEELQANAHLSHHRCQREPLQSIRKTLLGRLNLEREPQLPASGLDLMMKRWRTTFGDTPGKAQDSAVPAVAESCGDNSTSPKCCPVSSKVFLTDLGWDSWVIHPPSFPMVTCALCDHRDQIVQCPSPQSSRRDADSQPVAQTPAKPNCCQLDCMKAVEVVYVDEHSTVTLTSVQLPSCCSCGCGTMEPSGVE